MKEGTLLKGYGGFYYVRSDNCLWECSLRGKFRKIKQDFLPGDRLLFAELSNKKGVIEGVLPRTNQLLRPTVANVEQLLVVIALTTPQPDLLLLDRILIMAMREKILPLIFFNKADLVTEEKTAEVLHPYSEAGYTAVTVSSKTGEGLSVIRSLLKDRISVFAGPSGVGKSSLLNAVQPGLTLKTGHVSEKIGRGRHTTRHVELMELELGGFVADTPGFSQLELPPMRRGELQDYFPEIRERAHLCRFTSCLHASEPDCAVKAGLEQGEIDRGRYSRYLVLLDQVIEKERRY